MFHKNLSRCKIINGLKFLIKTLPQFMTLSVYAKIYFSIETDKRVATPITFVY